MSKRINAPAGISTRAVRPSTLGNAEGSRPVPGLRMAINSDRNCVPDGMSAAATRLRRAARAVPISAGTGCLRPCPIATSTLRIDFTSAHNSPGSSEARWSGPGRSLFLVKCFSIKQAPSATAAIATSMRTGRLRQAPGRSLRVLFTSAEDGTPPRFYSLCSRCSKPCTFNPRRLSSRTACSRSRSACIPLFGSTPAKPM